nr:immunoglobulin light chain junction region [Macaca mulatta]MPN82349.1 immunoglobulin light chain junction region [Macaca mulatta]MPN82561.1 immunoglobulin light chain junction region [Macaca mulatta]MPN82687.1 immunoglobulin light chain junction region [Macaca mulatta]MPN83059.1 immunoglobulin light chain junction region [Macaca mulatta]
CQQYNSNPLTC